MTQNLRAAIQADAADVSAIPDLVERYHAARRCRDVLDGDRTFKDIQQSVVLALKEGRSWREVGELLGVSGSRAEQISRGM